MNNNANLLPNITLGMEIRDDCGTVNTALEQCLNFVLGTLTNKEQICSSLEASDAVKKKTTLLGVVGPSYSTTTLQVNVKISYTKESMKGTRVYPSCRPFYEGYFSQFIFRHGIQFFRSQCYRAR